MADIFSMHDALALLRGKRVLMFGDSNMRSFYKDLIYLLVVGKVAPHDVFRRTKNMQTEFMGDKVVDMSKITAGRDFYEIREFMNAGVFIRYHFITRVFCKVVRNELKAIENGSTPIPDVIIINSCVWDLTRWGARREDTYKKDIVDLLNKINKLMPAPRTLTMWTATMPVATERVKGGVFIQQVDFMKHSMRFIVLEANKFMQQVCKCFDVDLLDLHYFLRYQLHWRTNDGLHWEPPAIRFITNLILTHIALSWEVPLPGNVDSEDLREARTAVEEASMENKGGIMLDKEIVAYINKKTNYKTGLVARSNKYANREKLREKSRKAELYSKTSDSKFNPTGKISVFVSDKSNAPPNNDPPSPTNSDNSTTSRCHQNTRLSTEEYLYEERAGRRKERKDKQHVKHVARQYQNDIRRAFAAYTNKSKHPSTRKVQPPPPPLITHWQQQQQFITHWQQQPYQTSANAAQVQRPYQYSFSDVFRIQPVQFWQDYPTMNFPWQK